MADCQNSTENGTLLPSDIVTRLRGWVDRMDPSLLILTEAANEIERLRAEVDLKGYRVDRLNAALDDITHLTGDRQVLHRIEAARRG